MLTRHRIQVVIVYLRRHLWLIPAGAVLIAAAVVLPVMFTGGDGYPHSWCASTMTTIRENAPDFDKVMRDLQARQREGAPVGNLIADDQTKIIDDNAIETGSNFDAFGNIAKAEADLSAIKVDVQRLNTACGKPANWRVGSVTVPSTGD